MVDLINQWFSFCLMTKNQFMDKKGMFQINAHTEEGQLVREQNLMMTVERRNLLHDVDPNRSMN